MPRSPDGAERRPHPHPHPHPHSWQPVVRGVKTARRMDPRGSLRESTHAHAHTVLLARSLSCPRLRVRVCAGCGACSWHPHAAQTLRFSGRRAQGRFMCLVATGLRGRRVESREMPRNARCVLERCVFRCVNVPGVVNLRPVVALSNRLPVSLIASLLIANNTQLCV